MINDIICIYLYMLQCICISSLDIQNTAWEDVDPNNIPKTPSEVSGCPGHTSGMNNVNNNGIA